MDAAKVYGVVVEYTNNNHGTSYTLDKGSAIELIADSVVFDKATYTETDSSLHEFYGYSFEFGESAPSLFTTEPYFVMISIMNLPRAVRQITATA